MNNEKYDEDPRILISSLSHREICILISDQYESRIGRESRERLSAHTMNTYITVITVHCVV